MEHGSYSGFSLNGGNVGQTAQTATTYTGYATPITFTLVGDPANPSSVLLTSGVRLSAGAQIVIDGVGVTSTVGPGFSTQDGLTQLQFRNVIFYDVVNDHISAGRYSGLKAIGNYTIAGNATNHISAAMGQAQANPGITVTIVGTPTFRGYFALSTELGFIDYSGVTFAGTPITSVNGSQYGSSLGGGIYTGGARLPGNAPGYAGPPLGAPY